MVFQVGIVNYDELGIDVLESGTNRCALTHVFRMLQPNPSEFLEVLAGFQVVLKTADGFGSSVSGAVVYDDDLNLLQARRFVEDGETIQAGLDEILFVIGRHDDGQSSAQASVRRHTRGRYRGVAADPMAHSHFGFCFSPASDS